MKNKILFYVIFLSAFTFSTYSQKEKDKLTEKKYNTFTNISVIQTYEKAAEKGYKSAATIKKLGDFYYFNADFIKATKWYSELFEMKTINLEPEYYFRYSKSLDFIGQNDKANKLLELFNRKSGNDEDQNTLIKRRNYLEIIKANSGRFEIENAGINSKYSDYGTTIYSNKIVFASARDTGSLGQRKHKLTNSYFTNLYSCDIRENMTLNKPQKFDANVNSKFHESTPTFTNDGKTMYFTRNNYLNGKKGKDANKITLLKIYKATLENEIWSKISELPFNSNNYSTAHPCLSSDNKVLYFTSDMPGTIGQSDLFKVKINDDGTYSSPENLGSAINTEGRETFPYVNDVNEIYFASDGHPGLGGLDIFVSNINFDNSFGIPQNVGANINSSKDDFAYFIDTKSRRGFFTSNREGGIGNDDIYKFLELKKITSEQLLSGEIIDIITEKLLPETKITLFDEQFNNLKTTISDNQGKYSFTTQVGNVYYIRAQKLSYITKEQKVIVSDENTKKYLSIALENDKCKVSIGDDLGKCFGIQMIHFDVNKSDISPRASFDLEKILDVLNQNSNMTLDIRSHTDSRQTFEYNETLSNNRAQSTIKWLIKNGINKHRLTGKGYGKTQLLKKCPDGIGCTEEEHQINRRSEFIITTL